MRQHYVIGDVHGEYEMLLSLVEMIPSNARLIFVGDLVNRGKRSREVIEFVRNHAYGVVRGNHEGYMQVQAMQFLSMLEEYKDELSIPYQYVGGSPILQSYKLLKRVDHHPNMFKLNKEGVEQLKKDLAWIETLPIYLELGSFPKYSLPIVVSHGNMGDYWYLKDINPKSFEFYATGNRKTPSKESPIFNIYGHIALDLVTRGENFVCVDTGCGKHIEAKLSAYCIETQEVIDVSYREKAIA
jgi:serine/threonine protein phosphatase 1